MPAACEACEVFPGQFRFGNGNDICTEVTGHLRSLIRGAVIRDDDFGIHTLLLSDALQ